jgi:hypothetical protein
MDVSCLHDSCVLLCTVLGKMTTYDELHEAIVNDQITIPW